MFRRKLLFSAIIVFLTLIISTTAIFASQTEVDQAQVSAPTDIQISSAHFHLNWNVGATSGGTISSPHYQVSSTIGQGVVGIAGSNHFEVCSGFWCRVLAFVKIYLPILAKN